MADAVLVQCFMDSVPERLIDDSLLFAGIACALVNGVTQIDSVAKDLVDGAAGQRIASEYVAGLAGSVLAGDAPIIKLCLEDADVFSS